MQDLGKLSIEELYELNRPLMVKVSTRQALTDEEAELHAAIIEEVKQRHTQLRTSELEERVKTHARTEEAHVPLWFKKLGGKP